MASSTRIAMLLFLMVAAASAGAATAQKFLTACSYIDAKISECLPFLNEEEATPNAICCKGAGDGFAAHPRCFCVNLRQKDYPINVTVATHIATACKVAPPRVGDCSFPGDSPDPAPSTPMAPQPPSKLPPPVPSKVLPSQAPTTPANSDGSSLLSSSCAVIISSVAFMIFSVSMV